MKDDGYSETNGCENKDILGVVGVRSARLVAVNGILLSVRKAFIERFDVFRCNVLMRKEM